MIILNLFLIVYIYMRIQLIDENKEKKTYFRIYALKLYDWIEDDHFKLK